MTILDVLEYVAFHEPIYSELDTQIKRKVELLIRSRCVVSIDGVLKVTDLGFRLTQFKSTEKKQ